MGIKENLKKIKEQIGNNTVKIIAVTKYATEEQISEAYNLGIRDFAESYVQNALEKMSQRFLWEKSNGLIQWHFIGGLQKNKVKYATGKFNLIHSVSSVGLAELINKTAGVHKLTQNVLLQVNISGEASKGGFSPNELRMSFVDLIKFPNIKISGLMTIAPNTEDKSLIRNYFSNLSNLKDELNKNHSASLKELSMGMSNDYSIAVQSGATMIRIGRALFNDK